MIKNNIIAISEVKKIKYPESAPFRPSEQYPEIKNCDLSHEPNYVYSAVRETFHLMGYDLENYGLNGWNPLGEFIKSGDIILIKPNMVYHTNSSGLGELCLYTQPSVVAAVIDYCLIALEGKGKIIIGDAPMQSCDFNILIKDSGYFDMIQYYKKRGIDIELIDFRSYSSDQNGCVIKENNANEEVIVDIGKQSKFSLLKTNNEYRVSDYSPEHMKRNHHDDTHKYSIHKTVLNADVIINIPKPKSHRKAGFTAAMKNLIGVNCRKEYLPHHTMGSVSEGGDEYLNKSIFKSINSKLLDSSNIAFYDNKKCKGVIYKKTARIFSFLSKLNGDGYFEGSWYGNHTISKTIADINRIVRYADKEGLLRNEQQRKIITIADMIISGEKEGPLLPTPKEIGFIVMAENLCFFDEAVCLLMGFDPRKVPVFEEAEYNVSYAENEWIIISNNSKLNGMRKKDIISNPIYRFEPSSGWKGHIELP